MERWVLHAPIKTTQAPVKKFLNDHEVMKHSQAMRCRNGNSAKDVDM